EAPPLRSRDGIFIVHVDDKSAVQDPYSVKTAQEKLHRYERLFNGHFDLVRAKFTAILQDLGHPSKTAAKTFAETFLYLLENLEGQNTLMVLYDCGPLNHNNLICHVMPQFLVDIGLVDVAMVVMYQVNHGKGPCDSVFGAITHYLARNPFCGLEGICSRTEEVQCDTKVAGGFCSARVLMPEGHVDWPAFFAGVYNLSNSPAFKSYKFKAWHPQLCVACRHEKLSSMGASLRSFVGPFVSGHDGVVRTWRSVKEGAEPRDFPVRRTADLVWKVPGKVLQGGSDSKGCGGKGVVAELGFNCCKVAKDVSYYNDLAHVGGLDLRKLFKGGIAKGPR
ncbi:MAG: hypothetical protein ACPIOQ_81200, partial [Promethearchaeia archaeon]